MFDIRIAKPENGRCLVSLSGRLDTATAPLCEQKLLPALAAPGFRVLVCDMSGLDYISSMGLRLIFKARKALESQNRSFMMVRLPPQIAKVFEIAAALPKEAIFSSLEEADRYLAVMQRKTLENQA